VIVSTVSRTLASPPVFVKSSQYTTLLQISRINFPYHGLILPSAPAFLLKVLTWTSPGNQRPDRDRSRGRTCGIFTAERVIHRKLVPANP